RLILGRARSRTPIEERKPYFSDVSSNLDTNRRHCEEQRDEAIHASASGEMDCFAEPVIGPRIARTRWLAMTKGNFGFAGSPDLSPPNVFHIATSCCFFRCGI